MHRIHPPDRGIIQVDNKPPDGLECPHYREEAKLHEDVIIIDTDAIDPYEWNGCRAAWRGKYWKIVICVAISNGAGALLDLEELEDEESIQGIQAKEKTEDQA